MHLKQSYYTFKAIIQQEPLMLNGFILSAKKPESKRWFMVYPI